MNGGSPKKKNFAPIRFNPLINEEEAFLQLALEEYDDLFPNIMTFSQAEFIPILEKFIQIALSPKGIGYPLGTISKILKIIQYKYYEPEYAHVNKLIQSIDDIKNCEKFVSNNYIWFIVAGGVCLLIALIVLFANVFKFSGKIDKSQFLVSPNLLNVVILLLLVL